MSNPEKKVKRFTWECDECEVQTRLPWYITGSVCPRCATPMWCNLSGDIVIGGPPVAPDPDEGR